jgi:hypothetical protein
MLRQEPNVEAVLHPTIGKPKVHHRLQLLCNDGLLAVRLHLRSLHIQVGRELDLNGGRAYHVSKANVDLQAEAR